MIQFRKLLLFAIFISMLFSCSDNNPGAEDYNILLNDLIDGPYIMYEQDIPVKYYKDITGKIVYDRVRPQEEIAVIARGQTPNIFSIKIMDEYPETKDVSDKAEMIFVTSDIEGNYFALTDLLIGNGIIDRDLNWSFGSNHLVLLGDMADRGYYVTEVLWLLYKIDQQAATSGGMVHFILGNHDIMCMSGDDRYADPKYNIIADLIGVEYKELYGPDSEIGRWMRTKNGIEKIGDYLFVHAGVSPEIMNAGLSIEEINNIIRPYYGKTISSSDPANIYSLFKSSGIFWYRGYFKANEGVYDIASQYEVEAILDYYDISAIFVGHTIVDNICSMYNNAVFAVNVDHPENALSEINSQALLIDGDNIYSVDNVGNRLLLY